MIVITINIAENDPEDGFTEKEFSSLKKFKGSCIDKNWRFKTVINGRFVAGRSRSWFLVNFTMNHDLSTMNKKLLQRPVSRLPLNHPSGIFLW
jgi:hypothetical protein